MSKEHNYTIAMEWTGNTGQGTKDYRSYERSFAITHEEKPILAGSSDPLFRGDPKKWNPEELLLASLASCHMLWYLHLCSDHKIIVTKYLDRPTAIMMIDSSGKGYFKEATLNPLITITDATRIADAEGLHEEAHHKCFIANSINFPLSILPKFNTDTV